MASTAETMRMTVTIFGLAIIGAWAAVLVGEPANGARKSPPRAPSHAKVSTLETLERPHSAVVPRKLAPPRGAVVQVLADQHSPAIAVDEEQARIARLTAGRQTLLENLVASEAIDRSWAPDAEARISASLRAVGDELPQWTLTDARCASSLCEVRLDLVGSDDPGTAATDAALKLDWQGERFARVFVGDNARALLFLARDGDLPWPAEPAMN
jgi:hypothetical protein